MARQKISGGAPVVDKPLGQATDEEREAIIAESQNAAIAKAQDEARRAAAAKVVAEPVDRTALAGMFGEMAKVADEVARATSALKLPAEAGPESPPGVVVMSALVNEEGDEVTVTHPEEMYGMKGSYSSYRVGPCVLKSKVRPGQTRRQVQEKLRAELEEFMNAERARAKAAFMKHLANAFEG